MRMEDGTRGTRPESGMSAAEVVDVLFRRWRIWVFTPAILAVLAVVVALLLPLQFRSAASFVPENEQPTMGGLSGLLGEQAAAFGLSALEGMGQGSAFYLDLLRSRAVREKVVEQSYQDRRGEPVGSLVEFFRYEDVEPPERGTEKAIRRLADRTRVSRDLASDVVTLAVTTRDPEVSRQIVDHYLAAVHEFNRTQRAQQTRQRIRFLEDQVRTARAELRAVEDTLERFLEANRYYENSPSLTFQVNRLERRITNTSSIAQRVEQQYQQARLDLLSEIPAISIVDPPHVPQEKVAPRRTMIVLTVTALGLVLGLVAALVVEGGTSLYRSLSAESRRIVDLTGARVRVWLGRVRR